MHSSRMHTGRSLTVCQSLLPRGSLLLGGVCYGGCVCSWLVSAPGASALGGVYVYSGGSALGGGCLLLESLSAQGGVCSGGVSALGEGAVSASRGWWYPSMH